jgi:quinone-modifying oxidoreductase subunit QmoC
MLMAGWGQTENLMRDPNVWLCYQCNDCSTYCPRGAKPGDVLAAVRDFCYEKFAFPSFMGKALANPRMLPALVLVPALLLLAMMFAFAPTSETGGFLFLESSEIDFNIFLPHSSVDAFFVFGNIMIFIFAAIGFVRFWRGLKESDITPRISFFPAFIATIKEIALHRRFRECEANAARSAAHMMILFGFIGAMITTGAIFVFIFVPHYLHLLGLESMRAWFALPIDLPHPVKFLGAASGTAIVVGCSILLYRRWTARDDVGANGYADHLFLYLMFFTGLTGMFSWLTRLSGVPMLAYGNYYVHLVFVFMLLWYMPYSKFAHMIYRTLALVQARRYGRWQ